MIIPFPIIRACCAILLTAAIPVSADNVFRVQTASKFPAAPEVAVPVWQPAASIFSTWSDTNGPFNCTIWSPDPETIELDETFNQTRSCTQLESRNVTARELLAATGEYRVTSESTETRNKDVTETKLAIGTLDLWMVAESLYGNWTNSGTLVNCTAWNPEPDSIEFGVNFIQERSCTQAQTRQVSARDYHAGLDEFRITDVTTETQSIAVAETVPSIGTKVSWAISSPVTTQWINFGAAYACSAWTPLANTVEAGTAFTQTNSCSQDQTRTVTQREFNAELNEYRNTTSTTETQTVSVSQSQGMTGTNISWVAATSITSTWVNSGAVSDCLAWAPLANTVYEFASFTQTRSCKQGQTRTVTTREFNAETGLYRDTGTTTENQLVNVSPTQQATGTKYAWLASTQLIGAWANTAQPPYACTEWTPAANTVDWQVMFTQTATCSQDQTRLISERERHATTLEYRTVSGNLEYQTVQVSQQQDVPGTKPGASSCSYNLASPKYYAQKYSDGSHTIYWNNALISTTVKLNDREGAKGHMVWHIGAYGYYPQTLVSGTGTSGICRFNW